jgi:hypothetical protein
MQRVAGDAVVAEQPVGRSPTCRRRSFHQRDGQIDPDAVARE